MYKLKKNFTNGVKCKGDRLLLSRSRRCRNGCEPYQTVNFNIGKIIQISPVTPKCNIKRLLIIKTRRKVRVNRRIIIVYEVHECPLRL